MKNTLLQYVFLYASDLLKPFFNPLPIFETEEKEEDKLWQPSKLIGTFKIKLTKTIILEEFSLSFVIVMFVLDSVSSILFDNNHLKNK